MALLEGSENKHLRIVLLAVVAKQFGTKSFYLSPMDTCADTELYLIDLILEEQEKSTSWPSFVTFDVSTILSK